MGLSEEKADLVLKTDYLFVVTNKQRKQICLEACKWALAKNLDLAKDRTIPLKIRQKIGFIRSANLIKTTPGLKRGFNYDDVDLSLYNGSPRQLEQIRQGLGWTCHIWVFDCYLYGYLKVKEKDLRKAAKLWGYSFEEFIERIWKVQVSGRLWAHGGKAKKKGISGLYFPGAGMHFEPDRYIKGGYPGHLQMTLGKFGYTSSGNFCPDISKAIESTGSHYYRGWSFPIFENPILQSAVYCSSTGSEVYLGSPRKGGQWGVFHLPNNRRSLQKLQPKPEPELKKPWFGIEVKITDTCRIENTLIIEKVGDLIITKVYPQSPAEKAGIKEGDVFEVLVGAEMKGEKRFERLRELLEDIAKCQARGVLYPEGPTYIKRNGKRIEILREEVSVEFRQANDIPEGSY